MATRGNVWPFDVIWPPRPAVTTGDQQRTGSRHLIPVLLQASRPSSRNRFVHSALKKAIDKVKMHPGLPPLVFESIRSFHAGSIHHELWEAIRDGDIVVADITGLNPNVLYELGAAAAIKGLDRVLILREQGDPVERPFDILPFRHIEYDQQDSTSFVDALSRNLYRAQMASMVEGSGNALLRRIAPATERILDVRFSGGADVPWLVSPPAIHREATSGGLVFGHVFNFVESWLCLAGRLAKDVMVEVEISFAMRLEGTEPHDAFLGIGVRKEHPYADLGHLFSVRGDGQLQITLPTNRRIRRNGRIWSYREPHLVPSDDNASLQFCGVDANACKHTHCLSAAALNSGQKIRLAIQMAGNELKLEAGFAEDQPLQLITKMPDDVRRVGPGWIMIQSHQCLATLHRLRVELLDEPDAGEIASR